MANKVQIKRGAEINLPILSQAELAFTTDSKKVFIGDGSLNIELAQRLGIIKTSENLSGGVLGSIPYQSAADTTAMLAPNTTTSKKFLSGTGDGTNGGIPEWGRITFDDIEGTSNLFIQNQNAAAQSANMWISGIAKTDSYFFANLQDQYSSQEAKLYPDKLTIYDGTMDTTIQITPISISSTGTSGSLTLSGDNGVIISGLSASTSDSVLVESSGIIGKRNISDMISGDLDSIYLRLDTTNDPITGALTINNNLTVDTDTLFVDSVDHRVGIGTTSPGAKLDVSGNINVSAGSAYKYDGSNVITAQPSLHNYFFGEYAGNLTMTGIHNFANGRYVLHANTTGYQNIANGDYSLSNNTTGYSNITNGMSALYDNTTGSYNIANGVYALQYNTTGSYNIANGYEALQYNTTGNYNTVSGRNTLCDLGKAQTAGSFHIGTSYTIKTVGTTDFTAIGASDNNVGTTFTATGVGSGTGTATPNNTNNNTAIGYNTGRGIIYGAGNTILGANVTGLDAGLTNNIIIADGAGHQRINVDGSGNVGIGTTIPSEMLDVVGNIRSSQQLISTIASGTAPLSVVSTTLVSNLNADLLDGHHWLEVNLSKLVSVDASNISSVLFKFGDGTTITESFGHHHSEYALNTEIAIPDTQVAFGTGTGITGSSKLTFDGFLLLVEDVIGIGDSRTDYINNSSITTGTTVLWSEPISTYNAFFFDYSISDGFNTRAGTVIASVSVYNSSTYIEFTETSTRDSGEDTSPVQLTVDDDSGNLRLKAVVTSGTWTIKILTRKI